MFGPHTSETKKKIANALEGRHLSYEHRKNISIATLGKSKKGHPVTDETKRKISLASQGRKLSLETKEKLSKIAKARNFGGNTSKVRIWFSKNNGETVFLQSSYELMFAKLLEELNVIWERPSPMKWEGKDGKSHLYYPDFKIGSVFIDTKNDYLAVIDKEKIALVATQNNIDLRIVVKEQINKDFIASLVQ